MNERTPPLQGIAAVTEFTEWSAIAEATTESAAIPRRFVILADIRLSTEAPELGEPPPALAVADQFVVTIQQDSAPSVFLYQRTPEIALLDSKEIPGVALARDVVTPRYSPNNEMVAAAVRSANSGHPRLAVYAAAEGSLTLLDTSTNVASGAGWESRAVSWAGNDRLLLAHSAGGGAPSRRHVTLFSASESGELAVLDRADLMGSAAGTGNADAVAVSPVDPTRALVGGAIDDENSHTLKLISIAGDSISQLSGVDVGAASEDTGRAQRDGIAWHPDGHRAAISTAQRVYLIGVDGTTLTVLDQITASAALGIRFSPDGSRIITSRRVFTWENDELAVAQTFNSSGQIVDVAGSLILTGENADPRLRIYQLDGTATQIQSATGPSSNILGVGFINT